MTAPTTSAVRYRPILFSGEMVNAILAGRKTQTRRVVDPKHIPYVENLTDALLGGRWEDRPFPYGRPSDRLWVREAHVDAGRLGVLYRADCPPGTPAGVEGGWRPSIHMPRWASRITLEVTDVRVEQLRSISRDDAMAEGIARVRAPIMAAAWRDYAGKPGEWTTNPVVSFRSLWDSINSSRGYDWKANPWVWVIEFRRIEEAAHV